MTTPTLNHMTIPPCFAWPHPLCITDHTHCALHDHTHSASPDYHTSTSRMEDASAYIEFILNSIQSRDLFHSLQIEPSACWEYLMWMDQVSWGPHSLWHGVLKWAHTADHVPFIQDAWQERVMMHTNSCLL